MVQIYLPEHPGERDQLQSGVSAPDVTLAPRVFERPPRRFDALDLIIALVVLAAVTLLVLAASRWSAELSPVMSIRLIPGMLPVYAGYSLLHMFLAYLLSLLFTLVYGQIAATNRGAEAVTVPILDVLQSFPILSFLPALVHASGDREDLYQLGRDLQLEVDELLPPVDAADLLERAEHQEGDLVLTAIGQRFAEADVLEEKQVFRQQALARMVADLEQDEDHTVSQEHCFSQLQAHWSSDEARAQLDMVSDWGCYAKLFSSVQERGIFRLEAPETQEEA